MRTRKSFNRKVNEAYNALTNDKMSVYSHYGKAVREAVFNKQLEHFKEKYGEKACNELMSEIEADNKRLRALY